MSVSLKEGVRLVGLTPQLVLAILVVDGVATKHGVDCVVTSAADSTHKRGSLHYVGAAADFRTRELAAGVLSSFRDDVAALLGPDFDVVLEVDHLHVEWQPKTPL